MHNNTEMNKRKRENDETKDEIFTDGKTTALVKGDHSDVKQPVRTCTPRVEEGDPRCDEPSPTLKGVISERKATFNVSHTKILWWDDDEDKPLKFWYEQAHNLIRNILRTRTPKTA